MIGCLKLKKSWLKNQLIKNNKSPKRLTINFCLRQRTVSSPNTGTHFYAPVLKKINNKGYYSRSLTLISHCKNRLIRKLPVAPSAASRIVCIRLVGICPIRLKETPPNTPILVSTLFIFFSHLNNARDNSDILRSTKDFTR